MYMEQISINHISKIMILTLSLDKQNHKELD